MHPRNASAAVRPTPSGAPTPPAGPLSAGWAHRVPRVPPRVLTRALLALLLAAPLLAVRAPSLAADPNPFERQDIQEQAKESYKRFIKLWQEELYFELYDLGIASTRQRISREDFARRMVELAWVPDGQLNEKYLTADMRFRTIVYVNARVLYRHKFNPDLRFSKDQSVLLLMEDGQWHLDLIQLIRSPYAT